MKLRYSKRSKIYKFKTNRNKKLRKSKVKLTKKHYRSKTKKNRKRKYGGKVPPGQIYVQPEIDDFLLNCRRKTNWFGNDKYKTINSSKCKKLEQKIEDKYFEPRPKLDEDSKQAEKDRLYALSLDERIEADEDRLYALSESKN